MGRPAWPGPISLSEFLYPELAEDLDVFLTVIRGSTPGAAYSTMTSRTGSTGSTEGPARGTGRDQHWKIHWSRGTSNTDALPLVRCLEIVQERNLLGLGDLNHLTNWGAFTAIHWDHNINHSTSTLPPPPPPLAHNGTATTNTQAQFVVRRGPVPILIKKLSRSQRVELEAIGNRTPVRRSDGEWNCQDWCRMVLEQAVVHGILEQEDVDRAVREAQKVEPIHR